MWRMRDVECLIDNRQVVNFCANMKTTKQKNFLTVTEAAEEMGVTRQAVHDLIKRGVIPATRGKISQTKIVKVTVEGWKIPIKAVKSHRPKRSK